MIKKNVAAAFFLSALFSITGALAMEVPKNVKLQEWASQLDAATVREIAQAWHQYTLIMAEPSIKSLTEQLVARDVDLHSATIAALESKFPRLIEEKS